MSSPAFNDHTIAEEVATALQDSIRGKNVLLVGATIKSLGAEFLRVIAPYAKNIWVAGRSLERLQAAVDEALLAVAGPKPAIHIVQLDMTSFDSIRAAAAKINAQNLPIDVLVQNIMVAQSVDLRRSAEGFESQIGGNHFGTHLLVSLLLPRLRQAGPGARVVAVSSLYAMSMNAFRWDDPNYQLRPEEYESGAAYAQSKFANILFTKELAKRLAKEQIHAFTLHPGVIVTNGFENVPMETLTKLGVVRHDDGTWYIPPEWAVKTIPEGTATYVVAAFDPSIADESGSYLQDCQIHNEVLSPEVTDENAARLWKLTEELTGVKLL